MQLVNMGDHNGVPSYWLDQSGRCTGKLVFGVGPRDEPATLAGITHLVEHVLLRKVEPVTVRYGASVDVNITEFHASGKPDAVAGFLNAVADAICNYSNVSVTDLAIEKAIIQAENPHSFHQVSAGLLTYRFGPQGPGAGQFGAPGTIGISMDETIAWIRRWFTAANAALTFTGHIPDSLQVRLPPGRPAPRGQVVPIITMPALIKSPKTGLALSLIVPRRDAKLLGAALSYELESRLSHNQGLIYSVETITTVLDSESLQLELVLDPIEENTVQTLTESMGTLHAIASERFSENAIECACEAYVTDLAWNESVPSDYLDQVAIDGIFQQTTPQRQELLKHAKETTSSHLATTLKSGLKSLIVAVDRDVRLRKTDVQNLGLVLDRYELWQDHDGDAVDAEKTDKNNCLWPNKSRSTTLRLTDTHLVKYRRGKTKAIKLSDVVLVGDRSCGGIALMDNRGRSAELDVDQWKHSKKLRQALLQAFPTQIIRPFPEV